MYFSLKKALSFRQKNEQRAHCDARHFGERSKEQPDKLIGGKSQFNYPAAMGEKPGSPSPCTDPAAPNSSYGTTELGAD